MIGIEIFRGTDEVEPGRQADGLCCIYMESYGMRKLIGGESRGGERRGGERRGGERRGERGEGRREGWGEEGQKLRRRE